MNKTGLVWRVAKSVKKLIVKNIEIKSQNWILSQSENFMDVSSRKLGITVTGNIEQRASYPHVSKAIEYAIDDLAQNEKRTINNMLVIKNPYQYSPLCAMALFQTKKACGVRVTVFGKTSDCDISYIIPPAITHKVPIMGLYQDYENKIKIELLGEGDVLLKEKTFILKTSPLQGKNKNNKVTHDVSKCKFIYDLTLVYGGGDDGIFPYAFDKNGDIRFCFSLAPKTYGFQPISGGKFLFLNKKVVRLTATNPASTQLMIVDQMGRFHTVYNVEKGAHHDFVELKNGNIVTASNAFDGNTFEDTVIEIDRTSGEILHQIAIKDYIDRKYVDTADWAHLNTVEWNEDEKTVMVCLRNLHTVLKINYEEEKLVWILSNPKFWEGSSVQDKVLTPVGDMEWFFQAHASYFLKDNPGGDPAAKQLIIYDNHTEKRRPVSWYDNSKKSYIRIYDINESEMTVSMVKSFPVERSSIRSNAIYDDKNKCIISMSGKVKDNDNGKFKGEVLQIDYNTGELLNKYTINHGYYRAYEFTFQPEEMCKPIKNDKNYFLGSIYKLKKSDAIDVSGAKKLQKIFLDPKYISEKNRAKELENKAKENPDFDPEPEQDMARITMEIEENMLYVSLLDHQLEAIYFVGKNHTYFRDFTATKQERPEYFARGNTVDIISLNDLTKDDYRIYYKHKTGLYETEYCVKLANYKKVIYNKKM